MDIPLIIFFIALSLAAISLVGMVMVSKTHGTVDEFCKQVGRRLLKVRHAPIILSIVASVLIGICLFPVARHTEAKFRALEAGEVSSISVQAVEKMIYEMWGARGAVMFIWMLCIVVTLLPFIVLPSEIAKIKAGNFNADKRAD